MKEKKYDSIINNKSEVKAYQFGNSIEMTTARGPTFQSTRKIDKYRYVDLETGEIKHFEKKSSLRIDNLEVIKKTMKKLRRLISHNFTGGNNQLWITLTFSEEVTDYKIATKKYKQFMEKMRKKYTTLEYISVIEPQESGRWHFHVLLKDTKNKILYINNNDLEKIWNNGFTKIKRLKSTDEVGNYLVSYLSDIKNDGGEKANKGARLYFYPRNIRIYRRSKGIENPIELKDTKENILTTYNINEKSPNYSKKTTYLKKNGQEQMYYTEFYDDIKKERTKSHGPLN